MNGLWATSRNAFAEVAAKPRALVAQMAVMAINDLAWVVFWVLFFDRVGTLGGWDRDSILLLQAVLTTAGGLSLGLFSNARRIGAMAYVPARLAAGHWEPLLLVVQLFWIGALAVLATAAFGAGERRLQVVGG